MGLNNINSPVFATEAKAITKSDTIDATTFLNGSIIYVGVTGDVKAIVAGVKGDGVIENFELLNGGGNYTTGTALATTGGSGDGLLTVNITAVGGAVTEVTINNAGSGYRINDIITIDAGDSDAQFKITGMDMSPTAADGVVFAGVQAGTTLNVIVDYVLALGTTAGGLVSLK